MEQNGTLIQFFHWYSSGDGNHWNYFNDEVDHLVKLGITAAWLPPAFKAADGAASTGYDVYDLYDLGEFDQKFTRNTKYGSKENYIEAVQNARNKGLQVYVDVVLNHLGGGDEKETVTVVKVDPEDRTKIISAPYEIEAFTKFTHPGRNGAYSNFIWDHKCFSGVDFDASNNENGIYSIQNELGDTWEDVVSTEKGNYDYLMFCDVDFRNEALRNELDRWGQWYHEQLQFDGMRLDAVKHISPKFYVQWLANIRQATGKPLFAVGEYWAPGRLPKLLQYLEATNETMSLFDSSLHRNFHLASTAGNEYDMSKIFDETLTQARPELSVTVVDNHDTQPLQSLEAPVDQWFKPLAYSLILLRKEAYPCVFYPDLYGASYKGKGSDGNEVEIFLNKVDGIEEMLQLRKLLAYGEQVDYFDHHNCVGFTRLGHEDLAYRGLAVLMSNADAGTKRMYVGQWNQGIQYKDLLHADASVVQVDADGYADFSCPPGSVAAWVQQDFSL